MRTDEGIRLIQRQRSAVIPGARGATQRHDRAMRRPVTIRRQSPVQPDRQRDQRDAECSEHPAPPDLSPSERADADFPVFVEDSPGGIKIDGQPSAWHLHSGCA
jgi:hypothetical protein